MVPGILIHQGPHTVAIAITGKIRIGEVAGNHFPAQGVRAHEIDGLAAHNALAMIDAAVCQHLHQLGIIPAIRDNAGKSGYRAERTHHGGFHMCRRRVERAFVSEMFIFCQEVIFHKAFFQIVKSKVGRTGHAKRVKKRLFYHQLGRLTTDYLQKSGGQFAGKAVKPCGTRLKGQRGPRLWRGSARAGCNTPWHAAAPWPLPWPPPWDGAQA